MHRKIHVFSLFRMTVEAKHTSKGNRDLTCHSAAEPDCSGVVMSCNDYEVASWSSGGEMQQQADFMCCPCQTVGQQKSCRHLSLASLQTRDPWPPLLSLSHVFSCLKWMLIAVSTHSKIASSKSSGCFFHRNVCLSRNQALESLRCSKCNKPNVNRKVYKHYENDLNTAGSGTE